jgi:hypothetical protein
MGKSGNGWFIEMIILTLVFFENGSNALWQITQCESSAGQKKITTISDFIYRKVAES